LGHFFAHESCGKCYPCQMGSQRQMEILNRIAAGKTLEGDLARLQDVGWTMTDASLCGLGQTAASAVMSAIKLWPEMFDESKNKAVAKKVSKTKAKVKLAKKLVAKKSKPKTKVAKKQSKKTVAKKKSSRKNVSKR
jgi:NADH-ubiquinone oxidoreductase-F iron-sulfur binding region